MCGVCPSRYNPGMVRVSLDPALHSTPRHATCKKSFCSGKLHYAKKSVSAKRLEALSSLEEVTQLVECDEAWENFEEICTRAKPGEPYAHPGMIPGWSEYLWIPGYSDRGVVCGVYSSRYNPGMIRVSLDPEIL